MCYRLRGNFLERSFKTIILGKVIQLGTSLGKFFWISIFIPLTLTSKFIWDKVFKNGSSKICGR